MAAPWIPATEAPPPPPEPAKVWAPEGVTPEPPPEGGASTGWGIPVA